jgi:uncharacterized protein YfdQ (DUF2303 family)
MSETNTAETIADLARQQAVAHIVQSADGREFLIIPDGMTKYDVPDEHGLTRTPPSYLKQSVTLQATDSLGDYVNRFKIADTVLFADIAASSITAVLDFHAASKGDVGPAAKRGVHRATMQLPFSEEWNIWKGISGNLKPQLEFARFLEENGGDVVAPGGAELLEACRDLQANRKVNFIQAVRTSSENENFEYTDETEARTRGGLELPTKFQLAIPVYFGEPKSEVYAFLRWKLDEGKLHLGIQLHRAEHVRQAVFKQIVLKIGDATGCPVVFGKAS